MGALEAQKIFADIPICTVEELALADAIIFGTPTRFGNMCGQMRQFLDATGQLWLKGSLAGKAGSVFVSSATQHGGQESTIFSFHTYSPASRNGYCRVALCVSRPGENELAGARFQGKHVASIVSKLVR